MANRSAVLRQVIRSVAQADKSAASDRDLLQRFVDQRDQAAFSALVRRHTPMVLGVCQRALSNRQDAEDACQATFLLLVKKAKAERWQASIANWLYATARKVAGNARVAARRRARREGKAAVPEAIQPVDRITGRELLALLDEELDKLPARYREPLVLCCLEGLTRDEAATRLGIPLGTLKIRLERGRKRLGDALTLRGCALGAGLLALAITSPAGASPSRMCEAIMAAATGHPPAAVAALVEGVAMNGVVKKTMLMAVAVAAVVALGMGMGSATNTAANPAPEQPKAEVLKENPPSTKPQAADVPKVIPVSGRVLDPDRKPVAGAKFTVIDDETGTPVPKVTSGADGRFTFQIPYPQTVRNPRQVVASAPGFGVDWISEPREDAVFRLVPDLPITGRVIDLQGKPVAGAIVAVDNVHAGPSGAFDEMVKNWKKSANEQEKAAHKLDRYIWNRGGLGQAFHNKTAADGTFTLSGFGKDRVVTLFVSGCGIADTYAAVATRAGFDPSGAPKTPLRLYPPNFTLVVDLDKPVTGVVRDETTKAPLPGTRVTGASLTQVQFGTYMFHAWPSPTTTTDKEGKFTLRGLAKAKAYVIVADPEEGTEHLHRFGYVLDTTGFAAITTGIDLPRGVILTGRVTDAATGAGAPSRVFYRPLEKNALLDKFGGYDPPDLPAPWHRGRDTKTDFDGRYKITVMPGAGVVNFQAYGAGVNGLGYQKTGATKQEIDDGIVDRQFGHFRTVGQGGMYNPEYMNAYKVISPAATDRTATLDVTLREMEMPKPGGK
jgi:RNA polymerase sigma factor (sigma-70 family)